eukprot:14331424-Alexandrium_andersonii.AAC.1
MSDNDDGQLETGQEAIVDGMPSGGGAGKGSAGHRDSGGQGSARPSPATPPAQWRATAVGHAELAHA